MNALSKLLAKVAIRAIAKSTTETELLAVGDKLVVWRPLILEEHINAIAESMVEYVDDVVPVQAMEQPEIAAEPSESDSEPVSEQEGTEVQEDASEASEAVTELEGMTKSELIQYADDHGVHVLQSWTKAEIIAAIREAE